MAFILLCSIEELRSISLQLFEALEYLHDNQVVVRNLSLDNIFVTGSKQIKLKDHGLFYMTDCTAGVAFDIGFEITLVRLLTCPRDVRYLSPSVLAAGPRSLRVGNPKDDVWASGIIILELALVGVILSAFALTSPAGTSISPLS